MIVTEKNKEQVSGQLDRQNEFLVILPEIRRQALFAFRALRNESMEEAVAEAIANAFVAFNRLMEQGKGAKKYASALARYAVAQNRSGRKVGTSLNSNCVLSEAARQKHGLQIDRLDYCARCGELMRYTKIIQSISSWQLQSYVNDESKEYQENCTGLSVRRRRCQIIRYCSTSRSVSPSRLSGRTSTR